MRLKWQIFRPNEWKPRHLFHLFEAFVRFPADSPAVQLLLEILDRQACELGRPSDGQHAFLVKLAGHRLTQVWPRGEQNLHGMREEGFLAVVETRLGYGFELFVQKGSGCAIDDSHGKNSRASLGGGQLNVRPAAAPGTTAARA